MWHLEADSVADIDAVEMRPRPFAVAKADLFLNGSDMWPVTVLHLNGSIPIADENARMSAQWLTVDASAC